MRQCRFIFQILILIFSIHGHSQDFSDEFVEIIPRSGIDVSRNKQKFSKEGINTINFLINGGLAYQDYIDALQTTIGVSSVSFVGSLATIPTLFGPIIFGGFGVIAGVGSGATAIGAKINIKPTKKLGQLIKASYILEGYFEEEEYEDSNIHITALESFKNKYLKNANNLSIKTIANTIYKANEHAWFGAFFLLEKKSVFSSRAVFINGRRIQKRKDIAKYLFPNNQPIGHLEKTPHISKVIETYKSKYQLK